MRSLKKLNAAAGTSYTRWNQVVDAIKVPKQIAHECFSPVCSTMVCPKCGECPNRCGFDLEEHSPHDDCKGD